MFIYQLVMTLVRKIGYFFMKNQTSVNKEKPISAMKECPCCGMDGFPPCEHCGLDSSFDEWL